MSGRRTIKRTLNERRAGRTDWARIDAMTEDQIEANAAADPDNGLWTDDQLRSARLVLPDERSKVAISMRLDPEVLAYFKSQGPGYQTRMNAVLRSYVRSVHAADSRGAKRTSRPAAEKGETGRIVASSGAKRTASGKETAAAVPSKSKRAKPQA